MRLPIGQRDADIHPLIRPLIRDERRAARAKKKSPPRTVKEFLAQGGEIKRIPPEAPYFDTITAQPMEKNR